jgi:DNA-binding transcriptional regulator GbsR (MarR family)
MDLPQRGFATASTLLLSFFGRTNSKTTKAEAMFRVDSLLLFLYSLKEMKLTVVQEKFVLHWGEMGTRWGINRTVAQIHALLYLSPNPLNAEVLADTLGVARSNISNSIRELQGWGIVKLVHVMGDRRDHFEAMKDPWEMFRVVLDGRKKREIDPTLRMLREALEDLEGEKQKDSYTTERLRALQEFFETTSGWYDQVRKWPTNTLVKFMKLGDRILKVLG